MKRQLALVVIAMVSGCQCYQAPGDVPDGGRLDAGGSDGSVDAGVDAGVFDAGIPQCDFANQCPAPTNALCNWFGMGDGGVRSCVAQRCVTECGQPRTCFVGLDAGTLACDDQSKIREVGTTCMGAFTARVEGSTCAALKPMDQIPFSVSGACRWTSTLGEIISLDQSSEFVARFQSLGGICTGVNLVTGVERWEFNCPDCQFVISL